jgi:hypothetical protein
VLFVVLRQQQILRNTTSAARFDDSCALGWNAKMIGFPVLIAIITLKIGQQDSRDYW